MTLDEARDRATAYGLAAWLDGNPTPVTIEGKGDDWVVVCPGCELDPCHCNTQVVRQDDY